MSGDGVDEGDSFRSEVDPAPEEDLVKNGLCGFFHQDVVPFLDLNVLNENRGMIILETINNVN